VSTQIFLYRQNSVRVAKVDEDGTPWFVAKDVCDALTIVNVTRAIDGLDDDEKGLHTVNTPGGPQEMAVISEPGLYALVHNSRKPEARAFKRWVNHEVLPEIRRTGRFNVVKPTTELDAIEANARAVVQMVGEIRESRRIAAEALQKADDNSQKIAVLSREQQALIERQQAALASIPTPPEPKESVTPRTTRNNVNEVLRHAAIVTGTPFNAIIAKAYREFRDREHVDVMQRLRILKKKRGNSGMTGFDILEQLGHMDRFYALCVRLFGRTINPVPLVETPED
jgi:prophage antirepressor-like protein